MNEQPKLVDLFAQHSEALATLKDMLAGELPAKSEDDFLYDDLFLLRYVLSFERKGKLPKAAKAIRETLAYRREHAETLAQAANGVFPKPHVDAAFRRHMPQGL